jgi:hypothetical protein
MFDAFHIENNNPIRHLFGWGFYYGGFSRVGQ